MYVTPQEIFLKSSSLILLFRVGPKRVFLTNLLGKMILLVCGPHFEEQVFKRKDVPPLPFSPGLCFLPEKTYSLGWADSRKLISPHFTRAGFWTSMQFSLLFHALGMGKLSQSLILGVRPSCFLFLRCIAKHTFYCFHFWPSMAGQANSRKASTSALLAMPKPLTVWITTNCGKFFKRWEYQTTWSASWEIYIQVEKQQLELDMEHQTGSKSGKEYVKAVYCCPAYLTYMQSTLWEMLGCMKHKLESRLPGEISITSDMQMTPHLSQKAKRN